MGRPVFCPDICFSILRPSVSYPVKTYELVPHFFWRSVNVHKMVSGLIRHYSCTVPAKDWLGCQTPLENGAWMFINGGYDRTRTCNFNSNYRSASSKLVRITYPLICFEMLSYCIDDKLVGRSIFENI